MVGDSRSHAKEDIEFVGAFDLLNTIKMPKPCAKTSATTVYDDDDEDEEFGIKMPTYYIGQVEKIIKSDDLDLSRAMADVSSNNVWTFENGTIATGQIGYFDSSMD